MPASATPSGWTHPNSAVLVLNALKDAGYKVTDIPETGDELVHRIIERCSNDRDSLTEEQLRLAAGHVTSRQYADWFATFPDDVTEELSRDWGEPPGQVYRTNGSLAIAGIDLGNVFVGLQPPRGFGENPIAIYHSPDMAPTHHYIAYYRWVRDVFGADAILHLGKHGTWNGCRARASACRRPATRRWRWTTCRCSTRSSSTTPARGRRPSAAPTPPSLTT